MCTLLDQTPPLCSQISCTYCSIVIKVQGIRINNLKFAYDIDLLEESNSGLHDLLCRLRTESERYGMHINVDKTKTIVFGGRLEENVAVVCMNGTVLENVESSVYLDNEFTWDNDGFFAPSGCGYTALAKNQWLQFTEFHTIVPTNIINNRSRDVTHAQNLNTITYVHV